ncbi:MAG: GNAT family N-acetyltransferase [Thermodesulfovibrionales bacterium]
MKLPRRMEEGDLRLRPLGISDGRSLAEALKDRALLRSLGLSLSPSSPSSAWWWFKSSHLLAYCIEADSQRIGLLGISRLIAGESAELSLLIFPEHQGKGYGSMTVGLFAKLLKKQRSLKRLTVSVRRDNPGAISFWERTGFREVSQEPDGIMRLALNL